MYRAVVMVVGVMLTANAVSFGALEPKDSPVCRADTARSTRDPISQTAVRRQQHHEVPDAPPAPAGVLERRAVEPSRAVSFGVFTSVQVNVDAMGNNIVGDAANEPSIAIDPNDPNIMAIGWRQFDTIASNHREAGWAYSQDGGQTWTFPGTVEPGAFRSDPVLAADLDGNLYYSSLSFAPGLVAHVFKSTDGGVTWGPPVWAFGGDKQWIAIDRTDGIGRGNIYQQWRRTSTCCPPFDFTRSTDGGLSFEDPIATPEPGFQLGTLDIGPDGTLYMTGIDSVDDPETQFVFARSTNAKDPAQTPSFDLVSELSLGGTLRGHRGPNPGGLLAQVWVATDHSDGPTRGNVYILSPAEPPGGDPMDIMFIRSTDGGVTWSDPVRINDDPTDNGAWQWFGTMSVAPNGRIDVIWNDTRNTGVVNLSQVFYAFSTDAGVTWKGNIPVTPRFNSWVGWPNQDKIGDYYHMISFDDGANLAYSATFNGEQDVYFLSIRADCNGNGVDDATDISVGTSGDCNGNGYPDECEDCNGNTVADSCDIADGTSEDCNGNNAPDECESNEDCNQNGVQDICDIAAGTSVDCNYDRVPDECTPPIDPPNAQVPPTPKNRYLSFVPGNAGKQTAVRVMFVDLPPPHDVANGRMMWVGSPFRYCESAGQDWAPEPNNPPDYGCGPAPGLESRTFWVATLRCDPLYTDWSVYDIVHVDHESIVPGGTCEMQAIEDHCNTAVETSYSAPLEVTTSVWGDTVVAPPGEVDFDDITAVVDKFRDLPGAPRKPRVDLAPDVTDKVINFTDIPAVVDAFRGLPYPYPPPPDPCP